MKMQCPNCGKEVEIERENGDGSNSASEYPQRWINCPHCGYVGAWDVEFGWKDNFGIPPSMRK